jgi:hypothetical protein
MTMVTVNVVVRAPGDNEVSVRVDGRPVRAWRSSALRGDFAELHAEAHRIALQIAREFLEGVVCRWCELRSGEGGIR